MKRPEGSPFRIESAGFECAFDRGVTGMDLRCEAANSPAPGMFDKSLQQSASYSSVAPRLFNEHFDQVQGFAAIFRPPRAGSVGEAADESVILGDQNHSKLRRRENAFVYTPGFLRCRARVPGVEEFFGELAHPVEVPQLGGSDWNRQHSDSSLDWKSVAIVGD